MGSQVTSGNVSGEKAIYSLRIRGSVGFARVSGEGEGLVNKANILCRTTGLRVHGSRGNVDSFVWRKEEEGLDEAKGPDPKAPCEWPLRVVGEKEATWF